MEVPRLGFGRTRAWAQPGQQPPPPPLCSGAAVAGGCRQVQAGPGEGLSPLPPPASSLPGLAWLRDGDNELHK